MPLVRNVETDPGGAPIVGAPVHVRLVATLNGYAAGYVNSTSVIGKRGLRTDNAGAWSLTLTANSLLAPPGTVYVIDVTPPGAPPIRHTVSVPNGAGPYWVGDILAAAPSALPVPTSAAAVSVTPTGTISATDAQAALAELDAEKIPLTQKAAANGVATLGADSKVPTGQLPALAINDVFVVASQAAMLALTAERGDMAIRTDTSQTFVLAAEPATVLGNWQLLATPTDAVTSVDGLTGTVVLPADGAAGVATKRTLGTGAAQAAAGTHAHSGTYVPGDPVLAIVYNANGTIASVDETAGGTTITTTFTYNADGTIATSTRLGVTRTYSYSGGQLTGVA